MSKFEPHEMKVLVTRNEEVHEILMREVSYEVVPTTEERLEQLFEECETPEEFTEKVKSEGLV